MSELDDDARLLLELARDAHWPEDADRARVRAELARRIGTAAGLGLTAGLGAATKTTVTAVTATQITAGAVGASAVTAKLVAVALIISATVGVGATVVHHARQASVAHRAAVEKPVHVQPAPRATGAAVPALPPEPTRPMTTVPPSRPLPLAREASGRAIAPPAALTVPAAPTPPEAPPVREAPSVPVARAAPAAAAAATRPKPPVARPAVDDEVRLVHDGLIARRAGQPARALELLDRHASLYPRGVLAEERDAERALALADLGRVAEARAAIDAFLRAHPASPLAAGLRDRAQRLH